MSREIRINLMVILIAFFIVISLIATATWFLNLEFIQFPFEIFYTLRFIFNTLSFWFILLTSFFVVCLSLLLVNMVYKEHLDFKHILLIFVVISSLEIILGILFNYILFGLGADSYVHLTIIQNIVKDGFPPGDPYYTGINWSPTFSLWHILVAGICIIFKTPNNTVWSILAVLLIPINLFVLYLWSSYLMKDKQVGLITIIIQSVASGVVFSRFEFNLIRPYYIGLLFLQLCLFYFVKAEREKKANFKFYSIIFFSLTFYSHLMSGINLLLALIFYSTGRSIYQKEIDRIGIRLLLLIIFSGLLLSSPWLIMNAYFYISSPKSEYFFVPSLAIPHYRGLRILGYYIFNPLYYALWRRNPIEILLAITGLWFIFNNVKNKDLGNQWIFLLSTSIFPLFLVFTPIFNSIATIISFWMAWRLIHIIQLPLLSAYGLKTLIEKFWKLNYRLENKRIHKSLRIYLILSAIILIISILSVPKILFYQHQYFYDSSLKIDPWIRDFYWAKEHSSADSIFLSDPETAFHIAYFCERKVAAVGNAGNPLAENEKRVRDVLLILNSSTSIQETMKLIEEHNVSYILINMRTILDENYAQYEERLQLTQFYGLNAFEKFENSPFFEEIYYRQYVWIFVVNGQ